MFGVDSRACSNGIPAKIEVSLREFMCLRWKLGARPCEQGCLLGNPSFFRSRYKTSWFLNKVPGGSEMDSRIDMASEERICWIWDLFHLQQLISVEKCWNINDGSQNFSWRKACHKWFQSWKNLDLYALGWARFLVLNGIWFNQCCCATTLSIVIWGHLWFLVSLFRKMQGLATQKWQSWSIIATLHLTMLLSQCSATVWLQDVSQFRGKRRKLQFGGNW